MAKEEAKKKTTKKAAPKKTTTTKKAAAKKAPVKKAPAKKTTKVAKKTPVVVQESNEYGKMIIALTLIALVLVACYCGYQYKSGNWEGAVKQTEDEKKFETEYETLNGTANEDGIAHKTVNILKDNNIKYITLEEADKMFLTEIESSYKADTYFPSINKEEWNSKIISEHDYQDIHSKHLVYTRK